MTKTKSQLRAEAVERLKNSVGARFKPDAAIIAIVGGRVGQADWSLECEKLIDLLTDDEPQEQDSREKLSRAYDNAHDTTFRWIFIGAYILIVLILIVYAISRHM